jgi:broad specificity phosphatase PhoE
MEEKQKRLNIYLIRHGEKDMSRRAEYPNEEVRLSKTGRHQAKHIAKRLKNLKVSKIISSDLRRCVETAEPLSRLISMPIILDRGLREVSKESGLRGSGKLDTKKSSKEINRIKRSFEKIKKENGNVVVFSSGGTNRIIFSLILGSHPKKTKFSQDTACINIVHINFKEIVGIKQTNDVSHLPRNLRKAQAE